MIFKSLICIISFRNNGCRGPNGVRLICLAFKRCQLTSLSGEGILIFKKDVEAVSDVKMSDVQDG